MTIFKTFYIFIIFLSIGACLGHSELDTVRRLAVTTTPAISEEFNIHLAAMFPEQGIMEGDHISPPISPVGDQRNLSQPTDPIPMMSEGDIAINPDFGDAGPRHAYSLGVHLPTGKTILVKTVRIRDGRREFGIIKELQHAPAHEGILRCIGYIQIGSFYKIVLDASTPPVSGGGETGRNEIGLSLDQVIQQAVAATQPASGPSHSADSERHKPLLPLNIIFDYLFDLIGAIYFLHSKHITHGSINPDRIWIVSRHPAISTAGATESTRETATAAKLFDFGKAKILPALPQFNPSEYYKDDFQQLAQTLHYMVTGCCSPSPLGETGLAEIDHLLVFIMEHAHAMTYESCIEALNLMLGRSD